MPDTLPQLFRALVSAFHRDAAAEGVDHLASEFTAQVARYVYETKSRERKLCVVEENALYHYENVHLFLAAYGLGLTKKRHAKAEVYFVGVRILPRKSHGDEFAGRMHVKKLRKKSAQSGVLAQMGAEV